LKVHVDAHVANRKYLSERAMKLKMAGLAMTCTVIALPATSADQLVQLKSESVTVQHPGTDRRAPIPANSNARIASPAVERAPGVATAGGKERRLEPAATPLSDADTAMLMLACLVAMGFVGNRRWPR
jgi:hypothetical protein